MVVYAQTSRGSTERLGKRQQLLKSHGMSASAKSVRFGGIPLAAGLSLGQGSHHESG
jgi:hypothetical protein